MAESDTATLETALVNADKAGDGTAAKALAGEIQRRRAGAAQQTVVNAASMPGMVNSPSLQSLDEESKYKVLNQTVLGARVGGDVTDNWDGVKKGYMQAFGKDKKGDTSEKALHTVIAGQHDVREGKELEDSYRSQWQAAVTSGDRLAALKVYGAYFAHPWERYKESVEKAFTPQDQIPSVPKLGNPKDLPTGVQEAGEAGAAVANSAGALVNAAHSPAALASMLSPGTLTYTVPFFAAKTWEAVKQAGEDFGKALTGRTVSAGTLSMDVLNAGINFLGAVAGTPGIKLKAGGEEAAEPKAPEGPEKVDIGKRDETISKGDGVPTDKEKVMLSQQQAMIDEWKASKPNPPSDYGIAARVSEARAQKGKIEEVVPGEGVSPEETIIQGRKMLESGKNPFESLAQFQETGKLGPEDIALARAHGEELAKTAEAAYDKFGPESMEYKLASHADSEWIRAIKPMQTAWHKMGEAQQGETELDTGSFHALRRSFVKETGKEFTPVQEKEAKVVASKVRLATDEAQSAMQTVFDFLSTVPELEKTKMGPDLMHKEVSRLTTQLENLQDQVRNFEPFSKEPGQPLTSAKLEALRQQIETLKERREYMRQELQPKPYKKTKPVKTEVEKRMGALDRQIAEIQRQLKEGAPFEPTPKEGVTSPEIDERQKTLDELRRTRDYLRESLQTPPDKEFPNPVWTLAKMYADQGETDYDSMRHKIATELRIPVDEVSEKLAAPKSAKRIIDAMYQKLSRRRELIQDAKNWLREQSTPGWLKMIRQVPRIFFIDKIIGHGTVGMITHAGLNMFDPGAWGSYWPNFFRQFKLLGWHDGGAYHQRMMEDLTRDPNFTLARRSGLANDPMRYTDDYQNTWLQTKLHDIGLTGNRGFDALKLFRQARFNQIWADMPESMQNADNAKLVADSVNHATGVVRMPFREWANWTFFAPKMEGSRWAWMAGDPLKAGKILANWEDSSPGEQKFAIREVKQKASIVGTYLGLLAVNQGLLSATGSKQQINFTDPKKGDFLAFKAGGYKVGIIGPMLGMVRLFANLLHASMGKRGQVEKLTSRSEEFGQIAESYARGKLSPFASFAIDLASQSDYEGRPLPFSDDKVPAYLRREGVQKYTPAEYLSEQFTPIPASEAIREVWSKQGMSNDEIDTWMKALLIAGTMGGTGAKLAPDTSQSNRPKFSDRNIDTTLRK